MALTSRALSLCLEYSVTQRLVLDLSLAQEVVAARNDAIGMFHRERAQEISFTKPVGHGTVLFFDSTHSYD